MGEKNICNIIRTPTYDNKECDYGVLIGIVCSRLQRSVRVQNSARAASVDAVGTVRAGTNCGSCRSEILRMLPATVAARP
jgi:hypothetical protein